MGYFEIRETCSTDGVRVHTTCLDTHPPEESPSYEDEGCRDSAKGWESQDAGPGWDFKSGPPFSLSNFNGLQANCLLQSARLLSRIRLGAQ